MIRISWLELLQDIQSCKSCSLHENIQNKVPGQGNPNARLMIIGEGPGAQEDREGLAFVGPAGQLLTRMLKAIDLERDEVYIANVVKCRPPGNRVPSKEEADACKPHLRAQFALVQPRIILLMGSTALQQVLSPDMRITSARGKWVERKGIFFLPTFHPAALLRDEGKKRDAWHDMQMVRDKLTELEESSP
jgi:DNA polymerase